MIRSLVQYSMRPLARVLIDLLEHEPLTVHHLADITGRRPEQLEEMLLYLDGFGIVSYRQGYWLLPSQL